MKIHEYQAKELFKKYNIPVPEGEVAFKPDEAAAIAKKLVNHPVVVKAQIHAGGRGKGGGVKLAQSADEVQNIAQEIIGMTLVTHQTGPEGRLVKKVLVVKPAAWTLKRWRPRLRNESLKSISIRCWVCSPIIAVRLPSG
jgi:succinyl-CoA synthetase beta subunit